MIKRSLFLLFLLFPVLFFAQENMQPDGKDLDQVILKMGLKDNDVVTVYTQFKVDNTAKIYYNIQTRGEHKLFEEKAKQALTNTPDLTAITILKNPSDTKILMPVKFIVKTENGKKILVLLKEK